MSTLNEREAALRRALHSAADAVEPSGDGLQFIRARLGRPRPLVLAWADAAWTDIRLRAPSVLQWWLDKLTTALDELNTAAVSLWKRFGPTPPGKRRSRTLSWLRPVAALGVFVAIVAAGAYAAIEAQTNLLPSSANSQNPNGSGGGPAGNTTGSGGTTAHSHTPLGTWPFASPSASCAPKPKSSAASSPPGGIINPITSPPTTSSPSPPPSDSPSPGVSGATTTPTAGASASPTSRATRKHKPRPCTTGSSTHRITVPHPQNGAAVPSPSPAPTTTASSTTAPLAVSAGRLND